MIEKATTPPPTPPAMPPTVVLFEDDVFVAEDVDELDDVELDMSVEAPADTDDRGTDRLDVVGLAEAKASTPVRATVIVGFHRREISREWEYQGRTAIPAVSRLLV